MDLLLHFALEVLWEEGTLLQDSKDVQCTSLPKSSYLPIFLYPYLYSITELDSIGRLKDTKNTTGAWSSSVRQRSLLQSTVWQLYGPGDPQQWFTVGSLVHFWCPSYHITYIHLPVPYYLTYLTILAIRIITVLIIQQYPVTVYLWKNIESAWLHLVLAAWPLASTSAISCFSSSWGSFSTHSSSYDWVLEPSRYHQTYEVNWGLSFEVRMKPDLESCLKLFETNNDQINDYLANRTLQTYMKPLWLSVVSLP